MAEKKKLGRPTDNPKEHKFQVRLTDDEWEMLLFLQEKLSKSRSDIVRQGIKNQFDLYTCQKK